MSGVEPSDESTATVVIHHHPVAALVGGGFLFRKGKELHAVIDPTLHPAQQRAVLTHELVHARRRPCPDRAGAHPCWNAVIRREEARVDVEVARQLVPTKRLRSLLITSAAAGEPVSAHTVAEVFDVPLPVAEVALACHMKRADTAS
jgi:hypothetical protein